MQLARKSSFARYAAIIIVSAVITTSCSAVPYHEIPPPEMDLWIIVPVPEDAIIVPEEPTFFQRMFPHAEDPIPDGTLPEFENQRRPLLVT